VWQKQKCYFINNSPLATFCYLLLSSKRIKIAVEILRPLSRGGDPSSLPVDLLDRFSIELVSFHPFTPSSLSLRSRQPE
jgi:hypothetical protein